MARQFGFGEVSVVPKSIWKTEPEANILILHIPGFTKNQLNWRFEQANRVIKVFGEQLYGRNVRRYFSEIYALPENTRTDGIATDFQDGIFKFKLPKVTQVKRTSEADEKLTESKEDENVVKKEDDKMFIEQKQTQNVEQKITVPTPVDAIPNGEEKTSEANGKPSELKEDENAVKKEDEKMSIEPKESQTIEEKMQVIEKKEEKSSDDSVSAKATKKAFESQRVVQMIAVLIMAVGAYFSFRIISSRRAKSRSKNN